MRMLLLYILLALLGQQTPFLESENLKTSESEKGSEPRAMSNETFFESEESVNISEICGNEKTNHKLAQKKSEKSCELRAMSNEQRFRKAQSSQLEAQSTSQVFSFSVSQILYFENQIRLADSLYKNYLPQYNFEEVKAAVMFFDSCEQRAMSHEQRFRKAQSSQHEAQSPENNVDHHELLKFQNSKILEFLRARAHYYHAVGLTERDDIVGACEHYFIALEIMESETENLKTSKSGKGSEQRAMSHEQKFRNAHSSKLEAQSPDYEKIRFIALIYTRLGELFYSENYCNLAISKYRKALRYILLLGENKAVANTYKCLGNSYQLYDMPDSALYYYNMSIKTDSNLTNRLDVEKSIAKILFEKGEKDKAYILLKNNLNKLNNYKTKDSYYVTLGEMYYSDLIYDSATYFLKISSNSNNYSIKATSLGLLSTIYDSIDNHVEKAYCDNILSKLLLKSSNKTTHSTKLQSVYDEYKERKHEREKLENNRRTYMALLMFALFVVLTFIVTLLLWYLNKRKSKVLMTAILDNENLIIRINEDIKQKEAEIERLSEDNLNKGEVIDAYIENIEKTTTEINELKKDVNEKEIRIGELLDNIKVKDEQISNYKEQTVNAIKADINSYYETEICEKILLEVKYKNTNKVKKITLNKLKPKEIVSLKYAANSTLNHLLNKITSNYRKIDNEDLICICLLLLDISITDISELMGKSYNAVWTRITKIKNTFKLDADSNLQSFLLGLL
ncbi:MAG: hypothetical protein E7065_04145 [Lentimicrobiaceae bacterium]|nr:hypothetical protein [Lentimicrobiaceae bacterium]